MKLSIIVPVYKVEDYLKTCIESLLAQGLSDYEIILVDDGSPDNSGKICDSFAERFPKLIRVLHIDNGGQGRARNKGLEIARGEYIGFVDSDDWIAERMYQTLLGKAEETAADIVVCDFSEHFADGKETLLPAALQEHWLSSAGSSCNKLFRRSLIADVRFPEGLWYEDFYFSALVLLRSKHTEFIAEPLYIYRRGQESTMHNNNSAKNLDIITIMDMLERELGGEHKKDMEYLLINHVLLDSISRLAKQSSADKNRIIAKLRSYVHNKIPRLLSCQSFKRESLRRRVIMFMNYYGLEKLAQLILNVNKRFT